MRDLSFGWLTVFGDAAGNVIGEALLPLAAQSRAVLLAIHRYLVPARFAKIVEEFRRSSLLSRCFDTALLDALLINDLDLGIGILQFLNLAVGVLDYGGDIVDAQAFGAKLLFHSARGIEHLAVEIRSEHSE